MNNDPVTLRSSWLLRLIGRHPLVRGSDRLEAVVAGLVVAAAILVLPLACALGTSVHDARAADYARRGTAEHELVATVTSDSAQFTEPYSVRALTPMQWTVDGVAHHDVLLTPDTFKVGDQVPIWVDDRGTRVPAPPPSWQAVVDAVCVAAAVWVGTIIGGLMMLKGLRHHLQHNRFAVWERELDDLFPDGGSRSERW
jgi:hypothetical protein